MFKTNVHEKQDKRELHHICQLRALNLDILNWVEICSFLFRVPLRVFVPY